MHSGALTIVILAYLGALIWVGARKARTIHSQEDFSLAGRGLSTRVLVGTLLATWIGTGSLFGNAEEAFKVGPAVLVVPLAGSLGILLLFFLAPRVRQSEMLTLAEILEKSYGPWARILTTFTLLCAYLIIVSYQYRAGAAVLQTLYPQLGHGVSVILVAVFVILYTALAGMFSVAYTDCANGLLIIAGITAALFYLWPQAGGATAIVNHFPKDVWEAYPPLRLISIMLPSLLLILGDANLHTRFFSAVDSKSARRATLGMLAGTIFLEWAIILVALLGAVLVANGQLSEPANPGHIIVHLAFHSLPVWMGIVLCATILAVIVSTADSYLLSPATSLSRDIERFAPSDKWKNSIVRLNRIIVVLLGLIGLGLAFLSKEFFKVSLFAYTIYGAGITPALLAALLTRPGTVPRWAGVSSICAGGLGAIAWKLFAPWEIDPILPAVGFSSCILGLGILLQRVQPQKAANEAP